LLDTESDVALIQHIYVSTARVAADSATLEEILSVSARNNTPAGITGLLLYAGGTYMQVLEGEEEAVSATHRRIEHDPRHTGIIVLEHAPITVRSLAQWSMGYRGLGADEAAANPAFAPFFSEGFDAARIGAVPGMALSMLQHFAMNQRELRSR
jgi:hypothetical protein